MKTRTPTQKESMRFQQLIKKQELTDEEKMFVDVFKQLYIRKKTAKVK